MNKLALLAAAAALAAPSMGRAELVSRESVHGGIGDWFRANGKLSGKGKRMTRDVSKLQLRGFAETPCDAPKGYFWHRAPEGKRLYYLLKDAPGERTVEYDERHDRSIIRSGWGYVKPTYAPGDVR